MRRSLLPCSGILLSVLLTVCLSAHAQTSRWAKPDEPTAKALIDMERTWANDGCTHNQIKETILADDFYGISPEGSEYSKADSVKKDSHPISREGCTMYGVKVHFFGDTMAILYGSESAIHIEADGRKHRVKFTWTDTWLKRNGKWQIVSAEDMPSEMK